MSSGVQQTPRQKIGRAVDDQSEPAAVGRAVEIDRAESDAAEIYRFVELPFQECLHVIERLRTMRVGPPALRRGNADRGRKAEEVAWQLFAGQRGAPVAGSDGPGNAAWHFGRLRPRTMTDAEIDVENTGVALEPSVDVGAFDFDRARYQGDRFPRPDRSNWRAPSWYAPEE